MSFARRTTNDECFQKPEMMPFGYRLRRQKEKLPVNLRVELSARQCEAQWKWLTCVRMNPGNHLGKKSSAGNLQTPHALRTLIQSNFSMVLYCRTQQCGLYILCSILHGRLYLIETKKKGDEIMDDDNDYNEQPTRGYLSTFPFLLSWNSSSVLTDVHEMKL